MLQMTSPLAPIFDCPNTRKNKRDYAALNKYGLLAEDIPLPRPRKKAAVRSAASHRLRFQPLPPLLAMFLGVYRTLIRRYALHNQYLRSNARLREPKSSRMMRLGRKSGAGYGNTTVQHLNLVPGDSEIRSGSNLNTSVLYRHLLVDSFDLHRNYDHQPQR